MNNKIIIMVLCLCALAGNAIAQTVPGQDQNVLCLYCDDPAKTYRCSVIGAGRINPKITKLYCLVKTAKEQNHASCRVKQSEDRFCTGGTEVTYLYEGPNIPGLTTKTNVNTAFDKLATDKELVKKRKEPGTLVEFTKESLGKTGKNFKKAGKNTEKAIKKTGKVIGQGAKNIGGAVKGAGDFLFKTTTNTMKCIFTLFNKCSDESQGASGSIPNIPADIPQDNIGSDLITPDRASEGGLVPQRMPNPSNTNTFE